MDEKPITLFYWIVPRNEPPYGHFISTRRMTEAEARRLYGPAAEPLKGPPKSPGRNLPHEVEGKAK
jgi:hypothetical protein